MLCVTSGSLLLVRVVDLACIRVERKVCLSFIMLSMRAVGGLRDEMLGDENFWAAPEWMPVKSVVFKSTLVRKTESQWEGRARGVEETAAISSAPRAPLSRWDSVQVLLIRCSWMLMLQWWWLILKTPMVIPFISGQLMKIDKVHHWTSPWLWNHATLWGADHLKLWLPFSEQVCKLKGDADTGVLTIERDPFSKGCAHGVWIQIDNLHPEYQQNSQQTGPRRCVDSKTVSPSFSSQDECPFRRGQAHGMTIKTVNLHPEYWQPAIAIAMMTFYPSPTGGSASRCGPSNNECHQNWNATP